MKRVLIFIGFKILEIAVVVLLCLGCGFAGEFIGGVTNLTVNHYERYSLLWFTMGTLLSSIAILSAMLMVLALVEWFGANWKATERWKK